MRSGNAKKNNRKYIIAVIITVLVLFAIASVVLVFRHNDIGNLDIYDDPYYTENDKSEDNIKPQEDDITSKEIFAKYYDKALEKLQNMSLEERVGQMFFARFPESGVIDEIKSQNPGGYIMFGRDFKNKTKNQIIEEINKCQENSKIPLLIGVDEEGGTVVRVSAYKAFADTPFKSPQTLYNEGGFDLIKEDTINKAKLLSSLGINVNLAPVCDVTESTSDYMYDRSFGTDKDLTAKFVELVVTTMNEQNMSSVLKHFPGYGNNVDTHTGVAIDKRDIEHFYDIDFVPFKAGINANVQSVLVSHNIVECMDSQKPASISPKVHEILRDNLNFTGVIMTDDLAMEGIKKYTTDESAAVLAVKAGNDMIISSDLATQKSEVVEAVKSGDISEEIINNAAKRIIAWKYYMGIMN